MYGDDRSYEQISQDENDRKQRIQLHFVDACIVQVSGALAQDEDGGGRCGHADAVYEYDKT